VPDGNTYVILELGVMPATRRLDMRRSTVLVVLLLAAARAEAGVPVVITAPPSVQPGEPAFIDLVSLTPGEYKYTWIATGHQPHSYSGREAEQTYSWSTPGIKSVVVDVFYPCGAPLGWAQANIVVQGTPWTGRATSWPQTYYWRVDEVDPTGSQDVYIANQGPTSEWSLSAGVTWLSYSPSRGMGDATPTASVDMTGLAPGRYEAMTELSSASSTQHLHTIVDVRASGPNQRPFGEFTAPAHEATVTGSIPVTGWVLDDVHVGELSLFAQQGKQFAPPPPDALPVLSGPMVAGARPDVGDAYPDFPHSQRAGWGFSLLTTLLPGGGNGPYTLWVLATDGSGARGWLGPRWINCVNTQGAGPFGDLDEPRQGSTVGGSSFLNLGWMLTPPPNLIPTDGSSIHVWIDGVNLGTPEYNQYRADIAALFSGHANASGAGGRMTVDTTAFRNGLHTIMWTATDSGGNTDGIGSRYFAIQNDGAFAPPGATGTGSRRPPARAAGAAVDPPPRVIAVSDPGKKVVTVDLTSYLAPAGGEYAGYTVHGDTLGPLPVGCTLDRESGAFAWQPGPAFAGTFVLEFWRTSAAGEIDSARLTFELGDTPDVTRKLHRPRRNLGPSAP
jgi:hypothetical protein